MKNQNLDEILKRHIKRLREKPNVLSFRTDQTKVVEGKDTGKPCITTYVTKKVKRSLLSNKKSIPKKLEGGLVDVVELSSEDYEIGETSIGMKSPEEQKMIMGLRKHE